MKSGIVAASAALSGFAPPAAAADRTSGNRITAIFEAAGLKGTATLELAQPAPDGASLSIDVRQLTKATAFVRIQRPSEKPVEVRRFSVRISAPLNDVHRIWYGQQLGHFGHDAYISPPWNATIEASGHHGLFLAGLQDQFGNNRALAGFRDQDGDGSIAFAADYGGSSCHLNLEKFAADGNFTINNLDEGVYVSVENLPGSEAVRNFVAWYDREWNLSYNTPLSCYEPAFNTWYAVGGNQSDEATMRYAEACAKLGFKTMEIDAGWFTDPLAWKAKPDRFRDLAETVRRVQKMGLNIIIWYNPFEVGKVPELDEFKMKVDGKLTSKLCPRNPRSRQRTADMASQIMREYGLDGLKIDFLDSGGVPVKRCDASHEHDCDFVSTGVRRAMQLMAGSIRGVKKDAIIEYRINYANVANRSFCNIYRGQDAPSEPELVRRHMALLRFWGAGVATHADYAYWTPDVSPEYVSRFMAGMCFYGVPTVSIKLDLLPQPHLDVIKAWLDYYHAHKTDFIQGQFDPVSNDFHYSVGRVSGNSRSYLAAFTSVWPSFIPMPREHTRVIALYNGTARPNITTLLSGVAGEYALSAADVKLRPIEGKRKIRARDNVLALLEQPVPVGGVLTLTKV